MICSIMMLSRVAVSIYFKAVQMLRQLPMATRYMQHQYVFGPSGRGSFLPKFSYHETLHVAIMGLTVGSLPEVVGHRIGNIGRLNETGGEVDGGRVLTGTFASSSPDLDKVFNASM